MNQTILFLCPHNAAKSVIAAAYFDRLAARAGLPFVADSAGTEPSDVVLPVVVSMLGKQGLDVSQYWPRHVSGDQLDRATRIVSMGCGALEELEVEQERVEQWDDIPAVSQNPEEALAALEARVERLVADLRAGQ